MRMEMTGMMFSPFLPASVSVRFPALPFSSVIHFPQPIYLLSPSLLPSSNKASQRSPPTQSPYFSSSPSTEFPRSLPLCPQPLCPILSVSTSPVYQPGVPRYLCPRLPASYPPCTVH